MARKPSSITSERKESIYKYIIAYSRKTSGIPPTIREISRHTRLSMQAVVDNVKSLELDGAVKRINNLGARNISVSGASWHPPVEQKGISA